MTDASEWHRAGVAVCGVTLVLLVAAGIRFIGPARQDPARRSPSTDMATAPTVGTAPPVQTSPTSADIPSEPLPQPRRHVASPRLAGQVLADAIGLDALEDGNGPRLAAPLVPSLEIPENSLQFEPIRMPVSTEFDEPALPIAASDDGADRDRAARGARQRDPVTAPFVTAGSAVAGGFRTAGRALKRAF